MNKDCIFCNIVAGQTETRFLYEDDTLVVFRDIHPQAPVHLLIVPRKHIRSINDVTPQDNEILSHVIRIARTMAGEQGVQTSGYKLIYNVERGGGQVIFHLHLHLCIDWGDR